MKGMKNEEKKYGVVKKPQTRKQGYPGEETQTEKRKKKKEMKIAPRGMKIESIRFLEKKKNRENLEEKVMKDLGWGRGWVNGCGVEGQNAGTIQEAWH